MTKTTTTVGRFAVYQANKGGIWIVRDKKAGREIAHEATKAAAIAVAKAAN